MVHAWACDRPVRFKDVICEWQWSVKCVFAIICNLCVNSVCKLLSWNGAQFLTFASIGGIISGLHCAHKAHDPIPLVYCGGHCRNSNGVYAEAFACMTRVRALPQFSAVSYLGWSPTRLHRFMDSVCDVMDRYARLSQRVEVCQSQVCVSGFWWMI